MSFAGGLRLTVLALSDLWASRPPEQVKDFSMENFDRLAEAHHARAAGGHDAITALSGRPARSWSAATTDALIEVTPTPAN